MQSDPWSQALLLNPPIMFGRQLLPFSLSHKIILQLFDSPYSDNSDPCLSDLLFAVSVCSRTLDQNREFLAKQNYSTESWWAWLWRYVNFDIANASFLQYMSDYRRLPSHLEMEENKGDTVKAPLEWHIVRVLMSHYHMTKSEAWNCGYSEAICLFDTHAEANGYDTLASEYDQRMEDIRANAMRAHERGDKAAEDFWDNETQRLINEYRAKGKL